MRSSFVCAIILSHFYLFRGQQTGAGPARRPMQGMGLSNNPSGAGFGRGGGVRREPLAPLEVGDGGDVKRARR